MKKIILSLVAAATISNASPVLDVMSGLYGEKIESVTGLSYRIIGADVMVDKFLQDFIARHEVEIGSLSCKAISGAINIADRLDDHAFVVGQLNAKGATGCTHNNREHICHRLTGEQAFWKDMGIMERFGLSHHKKVHIQYLAPAICKRKPILKNFIDVEYEYQVELADFFAFTERALAVDTIDNTVNARFKAVDKYGGRIEARQATTKDTINISITYDLSTGGGTNGFLIRYQAKRDGKDFYVDSYDIQNLSLSIYQSGEKKEALFRDTKRNLDKQILVDIFKELGIFENEKGLERFVKIASGTDKDFEEYLKQKLISK